MRSFGTLAEVARDLRRRRYSATELARATLERLGGIGTALHAVAEITEARAMTEARAADRRLRAGDPGPLCGVPYGVKDLIAVAGVPTRWGTPFYRDQVFDHDATVITRLRRAGAVLVAKLAMIEVAGGGGYRDPGASITGATLNPWDAGRWAGGSSTGPAAAVAAGIVPFAVGSETTGSIVIPASFCGITGVRPSFGMVSRHGVMPLAWSLDKIGPLALTAQDCEAVLAAIAGRDPLDATTTDAAYRRSTATALRFAVLPYEEGRYPDVRRSFDEVLRVVRRLGWRSSTVTVPSHDFRKIAATLLAGESAAAHAELIAGPGLAQLLDATQRQNLARNAQLPARDYVRAVEARAVAVRDVRAMFDRVDVLITPTVMTEAVRVDSDLDEWRPHYHYGSMAAVAGLPGVSAPMRFGAGSLPLGVSFIADQGRDAMALRAAALYQRATDWHRQHPSLDAWEGSRT